MAIPFKTVVVKALQKEGWAGKKMRRMRNVCSTCIKWMVKWKKSVGMTSSPPLPLGLGGKRK